jgi:hypothetical protein
MRIRTLWIVVLLLGAWLPEARAGESLDPTEGGVFSLGWNAKGNRFAYGIFSTTMMISNGSRLSLAVLDLVDDKVLWQGGNTWDEGNVGGEEAGYYPRSVDAAWQTLSASASAALAGQGIKRTPPAPPDSFPLTRGGDVVTVEVKSDRDKGTYELWAVSDNLGRKKISSGQAIDEVRAEGYYLSPDGSRMAVVVNLGMQGAYPGTQVVGCHLKAGFKKDTGMK